MQVKQTKKMPKNSTVTAEDFIKAAKKYLNLPFASQGRDMNGLDCGGLLLVTWKDLGLVDLEVLGYNGAPEAADFAKLLKANLREVKKDTVKIGDVVAVDYGTGIQHTAIVSALEPRLTVIHAKSHQGVTEQYLYGRDLRGWVKTYRLKHLVARKRKTK